MKLHVLSDLHNEFHAFDAAAHADAWLQVEVVVLAGDIGHGVDGLRWARESFASKPVVYIAGNHEFYGGYWQRTLDDMRQAAREFDVAFLENDAVEIHGVRFLGCTLWTDFDLFGEKDRNWAMQLTGTALNDYRRIKNDSLQSLYYDVHARPHELVPEHTRLRHLASRAWLEKELARGDPDRTAARRPEDNRPADVRWPGPATRAALPRYARHTREGRGVRWMASGQIAAQAPAASPLRR